MADRQRRKSLKSSLLGLSFALVFGIQPGTTQTRGPLSPSAPGQGVYVLNWENPASRSVPEAAPPGWAKEYRPDVRHGDEPQLRTANRSKEPVRCGRWSARFQLYKDDPVINNGARAELSADFEPVGAERWYGFSIYLPDTWAYDQSAEIVTQWHQHWDIGSSPPLSIITRKGQWEISQNWEGPFYSSTPVGAYQTGRWTDWVVHVKWSAGEGGVLNIWKDGKPVPGFFQKQGKNTHLDPRHGNYMKIGIYKWDWSQGKPSSTTRRIMYYDELRIAAGPNRYKQVIPPCSKKTWRATRSERED
jgi:hypothetical protein